MAATQPLQKSIPKVKRIIPLFNRVLVKRADPASESKGGIVLPDSPKSKVTRGTVVAVGPGTRNEKGTPIPMSVKVGDEVMLPDYGGTKMEVDDQTTYFMFREQDIMAKIYE